jgi:hypothetical protein
MTMPIRGLAAPALIALSLVATRPADATEIKRNSGTVTACSEFGNGCVKARVRETRLGTQYLSSGGTWTWCGYSCAETLRCNTVDFWENQDGLTAPGEGRLWRRLAQ